MFASLSSLGVHVSGGVASGRGLPHGSSGVFSAEVVDVDEESVAMGSNHVPHFLIIETLILLQPHTHTHTHTHTQEKERDVGGGEELTYAVIKEVQVLPLMLSQVLFGIHCWQ